MVDDGVVPGMSYCLFERDWQVEAVRGLAQIEPTPERLRPGMLYDFGFPNQGGGNGTGDRHPLDKAGACLWMTRLVGTYRSFQTTRLKSTIC